MSAKPNVLLVGALLVMIGCAGLKVDTDYDAAFDFTTLKTFDWAAPPPDEAVDELVEKRVKSAVTGELQAKGFVPSSEAPDFLIAMHVTTKTSTAGSVGVGLSVGIPIGRGVVSVGGGKSEPRVKKEGTLVLDVLDGKARSRIWEGTAVGALNGSLLPEEQQARITHAVAEMLAEFPPKRSRE